MFRVVQHWCGLVKLLLAAWIVIPELLAPW